MARPRQPHNSLKKKSDSLKQKLSESFNSHGNRSGTAAAITASQKCSITLHQTDLDILDKIREYLRQKGVRNLSDSEGLRLACRTVIFDDILLKVYESMKLEDGRRRR
jgi:Na+-transporting NADH:ubiquinone oxidoreductase subunit NqrF